jgi:glycosyltransferase involved in cell wall biosynthesis
VTATINRWDWSSLRVIARSIRDWAPHIVNIQYQTGAYGMHPAINLAPRLLTLFGRAGDSPKFVTTFHDLRIPYLFPKAGPVREWVTRELASSSHAVIATDEQDYGRLKTWGVRRASLIPIGSNIPTVPPRDYNRAAWRAQLGVSGNELLLCHFGFVNALKGCDTLMRALAEIPGARLLMMGGQTGSSDPTNVTFLAKIKELIADLGLSPRVLWTGFAPAEEVTANFLAADLCVLPYREGASYQHGTLMAALAHGRPIVTTRREKAGSPSASLLPELRDGENCLLVPADDATALAAAIRRAAASPSLCEHIRAGAGELALSFTWDRIVQDQRALFESLLS